MRIKANQARWTPPSPRRVYRPGARWRPEMTKPGSDTGLAARTKASRAYADRARRALPGGVTAGVKYFDPYPIAMKKAKGCRLWDLDGNEYIDYCLSFGPLILGHGHPRVMKAIRDSLESAGTTMFGTPHELEATYAERLLRIFRPEGKMRFAMSGTEATVHAVRLARAYRKRPMIAKFEGHYHGGVDEFLVSHTPSKEEVCLVARSSDVRIFSTSRIRRAETSSTAARSPGIRWRWPPGWRPSMNSRSLVSSTLSSRRRGRWPPVSRNFWRTNTCLRWSQPWEPSSQSCLQIACPATTGTRSKRTKRVGASSTPPCWAEGSS